MSVPERRSLRTYLQGLFFLVAVLPLGVVFATFLAYYAPMYRQGVLQTQAPVAQAAQNQVEGFFSSAQREILAIARLLDQGAVRGGLRDAILDSYAQSSDHYEALYTLDSQWRIDHLGLPILFADQRPNLLGLDLSFRDFVREARDQDGPRWSVASLSPVSSRLTVSIATPLSQGFLAGDLGTEPLPRIARQLNADWGVRLLILDPGHTVVADSHEHGRGQQRNLGNLDLVRNPGGGPRTFTLDGLDWQGVSVRVEPTGWVVIVGQESRVLWQPLTLLLWQILAGFAVALLLVLGLGMLSTRLFAREFARITHLAGQFAQGRYLEAPGSTTIRELHDITASLEHMAQAIAHREDQLYRLNLALESRVEDRTRELAEANRDLSQTLHELRDTQDQLLQSQRVAGLSTMATSIAHELNTPLGNGITAITHLRDQMARLQEAFDANSLTRNQLADFFRTGDETLSLVHRSIHRASDLVASFKDVSLGQGMDEDQDVNIHDLVTLQAAAHEEAFRSRGIRLRIEGPADLVLRTQPKILAQVVDRLLANMLAHAWPPGLAPERTPEGLLSIRARGGGAEILVEDNGCGVPLDHHARIFDPFFTGRIGRGGLGLGLSICHNLIAGILGGNIGARPSAHGGLQVWIFLGGPALEA